MLRTIIVVLCFLFLNLCREDDPYGITIVRQNFDEILSKRHPLTILFYSQSCSHSTAYKQLFSMAAIKLKERYDQHNLVIADCDTQKPLCDKFKVSILPSVYEVTGNNEGQYRKTAEQQFLSNAGIIVDKPLQAQIVAKWLEQRPHYFVAVLEEEGFQAEDRFKADNVLYLNGKQLYKVLLGYTRGRVGCWIFKYQVSDSSLKKYICGSGQNPKEIQEKIQSFKKGNLEEFRFSRENQISQFSNEKKVNSNQLEALYDSDTSGAKIILYDSEDCWYCKGVAKAVSQSLKRLPQSLLFYRFMADFNQIPHSRTIVKLPYLELLVNNQLHVYEGRFSQQSLKQFFQQKISYQPLNFNTEL